jgi:enoyl-CoA hydratase/carnithine racemase
MPLMSLHVERHGPLAVLRLDKERGNAIDEALTEALTTSILEVGRDDTVRGVLLASANPKIFCPGLDLVALADYDAPSFSRFMARFAKMVWSLYGLGKPLVAAINGHAVAGGCILAMTADDRLLKRGASIGLNEIRIGVPLPWSVSVLIRATLPPTSWTDVALSGSNFSDEEAVRVGLAHAVADAADFEQTALARLSRLAEKDATAFAVTKRCLREGFLAEMTAQESYRTNEFIGAWFSAETRERRQKIVESLLKKG